MNALYKSYVYKFVRGSGRGGGAKTSLALKFQLGGGMAPLVLPWIRLCQLIRNLLPHYVTPSASLTASY